LDGRVAAVTWSDGARRQRRFSFVGNKKEAEKALVVELAAIGNGTSLRRIARRSASTLPAG
jgi:hypothetical protein